MGIKLNRLLSEDDVWITNKHMEKHSVSSVLNSHKVTFLFPAKVSIESAERNQGIFIHIEC